MRKLIAPLPASPDNFPLLGTVSHGTMRPEDLISSFCDALHDLAADGFCDASVADAAESLARQYWRSPEDDTSIAGAALEYLFDALDAAAPVGYYFGAHPGDGSDYGFWAIEED